jgi:chromosome segregation ATPase
MDSLQASLEAESRAKAEALRIKKKLESDINELEIALDHANKANAEAHKSIKRYQAQLRDVEGLYEEEGRQRREIAEKAGLADRRANALQGELEEARALLDSADRGKKQADMELADARGAVNDMTTINSKAGSDKRRLESAIHTMHAEIDDMLAQVIQRFLFSLLKKFLTHHDVFHIVRLRTLRRNPRRLWLMLLVSLMNLELSKSTLDNKRSPNALLNLKLVNLINA